MRKHPAALPALPAGPQRTQHFPLFAHPLRLPAVFLPPHGECAFSWRADLACKCAATSTSAGVDLARIRFVQSRASIFCCGLVVLLQLLFVFSVTLLPLPLVRASDCFMLCLPELVLGFEINPVLFYFVLVVLPPFPLACPSVYSVFFLPCFLTSS
jgi:hypothetical protein